jgi:hypothetical protein
MAEARLTCPSCFEEKALRKSHFRAIDSIQRLFRRQPYRCLTCNRRFYSHLRRVTQAEKKETGSMA